MDVDLKFIISACASVLGIGGAWGHSQSRIKTLSERMDEIKREKASLEKVENVLERLSGIEEKLAVQLGGIEDKLHELREDIKSFRR